MSSKLDERKAIQRKSDMLYPHNTTRPRDSLWRICHTVYGVEINKSLHFPAFVHSSLDRNMAPPDIEENPSEETIYDWKFSENMEDINAEKLSAELAMLQTKRNIIIVRNIGEMNTLVAELRNFREFSVDMMFSRDESYYGYYPCAIQITTTINDYLIDTLAAWNHVRLLKPLFESTNALKIFYDADNKLLCLQRFFGIFTVSHVDIQIIHKVVQGLKANCDFQNLIETYLANKLVWDFNPEEQNIALEADWSCKPLVPRLLFYAQKRNQIISMVWKNMRQIITLSSNDYRLQIIERNLKRQGLRLFRSKNILPTQSQLQEVNGDVNKRAMLHVFIWRAEIAQQKDCAVEEILSFDVAKQMAIQLVTPPAFRKPIYKWLNQPVNKCEIDKIQKILAQHRYLKRKILLASRNGTCNGGSMVFEKKNESKKHASILLSNNFLVKGKHVSKTVNNFQDTRNEAMAPGTDLQSSLPTPSNNAKTVIPNIYNHNIAQGLLSKDLCKCYLPIHLDKSSVQSCDVLKNMSPAALQAYKSRRKIILERDLELKTRIKRCRYASKKKKKAKKSIQISYA